MNVKVKTKVTKDADKLPKSAKETAKNIIEDLKAAATLSNIPMYANWKVLMNLTTVSSSEIIDISYITNMPQKQ